MDDPKKLLSRLVSARSSQDTNESFAEYLLGGLDAGGYSIIRKADLDDLLAGRVPARQS